jgi:phosphatidylinositol glycan class K
VDQVLKSLRSEVAMLLFSLLAVRALLFATSSFWFNYRHSANACALRSLLIGNGVDPSDVFLGMADDPSFSSRNPIPGSVFSRSPFKTNVRTLPNLTGKDVSVESLRSLLTHGPIGGRPTRISVSESGRLLMYLTGHGGEGFLKFRNTEELGSDVFADILEDSKRILGFKELLIIVDTCEGETLFQDVRTPGVTMISSSQKGEKARSSPTNAILGVPTGDLFSLALFDKLSQMPRQATLGQLLSQLKEMSLMSNVFVKQVDAPRSLDQMALGDFFHG